MTILIIFILFVIAVVVLIELRERGKNKTTQTETEQSVSEDCCGAHLVCEKDLLLNPTTEIIYYDDEELDAYRGISSDSYTERQVQQFSDVFYTLKETDVSGWLRSLQARKINLPDQLKDEALLIVREQRNKNNKH